MHGTNMKIAVLLYDVVSIVNAFDDIWRQEFYYTIASVNAVHVSRSLQQCAVAVQSWRYVAASNGFYFRKKNGTELTLFAPNTDYSRRAFRG